MSNPSARRTVLLIVALPFLLSLSAYSQQVSSPILDVQNLMSAKEFHEAGLEKLTPEEMKKLNAWLAQYALRLYSAASTPKAGTAPSVIESVIEGEFEGWSGETIFKLDNGQIWQQASYSYTYHYAYRPKVLVYKSESAYQMKVDGVEGTIQVKRLK
jgi:hypothetical protein